MGHMETNVVETHTKVLSELGLLLGKHVLRGDQLARPFDLGGQNVSLIDPLCYVLAQQQSQLTTN